MRAQQAANARFAANRALELPPMSPETLAGSRSSGTGGLRARGAAGSEAGSTHCASETCSFMIPNDDTSTKVQRGSAKAVVEGTSGALEEAKANREEMLATVRS